MNRVCTVAFFRRVLTAVCARVRGGGGGVRMYMHVARLTVAAFRPLNPL